MECTKCKEEKQTDEFIKGKHICKLCWSNDRKVYYQKNKERILAKQLNNYHNDKTKAKQRYEDNKEAFKTKNANYYKNNKTTINQKKELRHKERMIEDVLYRLTYNIRRNISVSFRTKNYTKKSKTYQILACSYEEFKQYLETKFEPWMNWDNYGLYNGQPNYGWDIDHIIPLSSATTEEDLIKLNHFTNLQPLCSHINRNIKKGTL